MADTDNGELDDAVKKLQDRFGTESIMRMGAAKSSDVDTVSTGSLTLDINTGIMGLPRGRIIETMGPESSGKTTIALQSIAEHQKDGIRCAFIDVEHAIDPDYASSLGVDTDQLLLSQPDTGEQALQLVDALVRETDVGFIVVDSVAALLPKAELEGDIGDSHVGLQARMMSQACRKLSGSADENQTTIFFINQIRQKIGVTFGSPETVPGGNALKFFSSMRIDVRRTGQLKDGEELVGNQTKIKIIKNKHAPPFKEANVELVYGEGISKEAELLDLGAHYGVLTKKGSFFYYGSDKLGQGKRQGVNALKEDPDNAEKIRSEIVEAALG